MSPPSPRRLARACARSTPALALLGLVHALACAGGVPPDAGLWTAEPRVDFGTVDEGSVLEHDFELEVRRALAVSRVDSDCGCTVARLERQAAAGPREPYELGTPLQPGSKLHLHTRYDTRGKRGTTPRTLLVSTSLGERLALTLTAEVRLRLFAEPAGLEFVRIPSGERAERSFRVRSAKGERFHLEPSGRALHPSVLVEARPEDPDESGRALSWQVSVRAEPGVPTGTRSYPIELVSDLPLHGPARAQEGETRFSSISPLFNIQVLGLVALSPASLSFGPVRADETVARTLRIECFDPGFELSEPEVRLEPLRPGEVSALARTASLRTRPVPGQQAYDVELVLAGLDPELAAGSFFGRLVVETGHPEVPRLEALVSGVCAPGSARR